MFGRIQSRNAAHARLRWGQRVLSSSLPNTITDGMVIVATALSIRKSLQGINTYGLGDMKAPVRGLRNVAKDKCPLSLP
jgi:hypothetical protein